MAEQRIPADYSAAHRHLMAQERVALVLAKQAEVVLDRDERGALATVARRTARAYAFLADTYEMLAEPPIV